MRKKPEADLAAECRAKFLYFCEQYRMAKFHSLKRHYVEKAYEQVDIYLDLRDIEQSL